VSEHAYIQAVNQVKEISGTYGMKLLYECVELFEDAGYRLYILPAIMKQTSRWLALMAVS
jgi:hypothetical protein